MQSILITGGNNQERLAKAKELIRNLKLEIRNLLNHPDLLLVTPQPSIGINQIRSIQRFLSRKPFSAPIKVILVPEAEKMTIPAQNSFLKTLEEPPEHSLIILSSQNEDQLLPTIISRCEQVKLTSSSILNSKSIHNSKLIILNSLLRAKVGQRLKLIEPYEKSREEAVKFLQDIIIVLRQILLKKEVYPQFLNFSISQFLQSFQDCLDLLNANINVRLCLDNLVLNLPLK